MQEAWEWHVSDYKMAFENKKRLSPSDYRMGLCLYHISKGVISSSLPNR